MATDRSTPHAAQRAGRGDVIAHLGDSGNSSVPHLHFHLSDKPVYIGSEGLPFRFAQFTLEGKAGPKVSGRGTHRDSKCASAVKLMFGDFVTTGVRRTAEIAAVVKVGKAGHDSLPRLRS